MAGFRYAALLAFLALTSGCQTYVVRREPLTTGQVIQMSAERLPPEEIIRRIRESRTVYILRARDVKDLLEKGVDERVVDEMLDSRLRDVERYYRYSHPYYYGPAVGVGYGIHYGF